MHKNKERKVTERLNCKCKGIPATAALKCDSTKDRVRLFAY